MIRRGQARIWHRAGYGRRGRRSAAQMAGRTRLPLGLAVVSVLLAAAAGCAVLGAALGAGAALQGTGFQHVGVNIATGARRPAGALSGCPTAADPPVTTSKTSSAPSASCGIPFATDSERWSSSRPLADAPGRSAYRSHAGSRA